MFQNPNAANNGVGVMDPTQQHQQQQNLNYNDMQQQQHAQPQQQQQQQQQQQPRSVRKKQPYVKITEQPAGKALRFRYECEGRSAGSIPGVNSTPENKTFPTIEIVGYKGRAVVVVSCVTKDSPYKPHPHNLVGKEGCKKGVCTLEINSETMRAVFSNLGIQCVKKKDIEAALKAREEIRVDPFKTGFNHRYTPSSIDLNSVRLCFQVFMESEQKGRFTQPLQPVVSEPIFDKKAMSDLVICRLCSCTASVLGNTQIILLCEKVAKEDIAVRFFEEKNGHTVWEAYGEFQHTDVHKQTAIAFKTPRYHTLDITEPAKVFIQLKRPSDGVTSEPLHFEYVPLDSDPAHLKRKRQKTGGDPMHVLIQQQKQHQNDHQDGRQPANLNWNGPNMPDIKIEPRDNSPQPFINYRGQPELTPSPQPLSPSNNYNNHNNTPSPYNMGGNNIATVAGRHQNNPHLMSPNHHYGAAAGGGNVGVITNGPAVGGGGGGVTPTGAGTPMDMQDYGAFGQQQHAANMHQQHYQGNHFGNAGATHNWEEKYVASNANNNLGNLNSNTNPFTMHNLLTPVGSGNAVQGVGSSAHTHWNIAGNHMHNPHQQQQQQHMHQQHQQQQQQQMQQHQQNQYQQQAPPTEVTNVAGTMDDNDGDAIGNNNNNNNNNDQNGATLSNLLNFDSEQLVRINPEDQQMLRLNSEDLQISNLSIST